MRKNLFLITAGVFGSLALAVSASADFIGFNVKFKGQYDTAKADFGGPNVGLVDVWNLYANFDDPNDRYTATFVVADPPKFNQMIHSSDLFKPFDGLGGGFWNWNAAANTPLPPGFPYDNDPAAAGADTYLTIGLKSGYKGKNIAGFAPGSKPILDASGILSGNGVINQQFAYFTIPDDPNSVPVDGQVLVLRIALLRGEHASGLWNVKWANIGVGGDGQASAEWTTVPAPGALALLGLAGLAGARRRRGG